MINKFVKEVLLFTSSLLHSHLQPRAAVASKQNLGQAARKIDRYLRKYLLRLRFIIINISDAKEKD